MNDRDFQYVSALTIEETLNKMADEWIGKKRTWRPFEGAMWDITPEERMEFEIIDIEANNQ